MQVNLPPVISEETTVFVRATSGESAELACSASGFPSPRITWTREDKMVLPDGKDQVTTPKLVISKVRMEDRGKKALQTLQKGPALN